MMRSYSERRPGGSDVPAVCVGAELISRATGPVGLAPKRPACMCVDRTERIDELMVSAAWPDKGFIASSGSNLIISSFALYSDADVHTHSTLRTYAHTLYPIL